MTFPLTPDAIAAAYLDACRLEVQAMKPGNVHVYADGHGMTVADFERSAEVSAPHIADPGLSTGEKILGAIEATSAAVGCNTNLGIVLLAAPLAFAVGSRGSGSTFKERIASTLAKLDASDAAHAFKAIALAKPAGLGEATEADVTSPLPPAVTLREAMAMAAHRDLIAGEYVRDFAIVTNISRLFEEGHSGLGLSREAALSRAYMLNLAHRLDTHIIRKHGRDAAEEVRDRARRVVGAWPAPGADPMAPPLRDELLTFDKDLKAHGLNPGALADLMAASVLLTNLRIAAAPAVIPATTL